VEEDDAAEDCALTIGVAAITAKKNTPHGTSKPVPKQENEWNKRFALLSIGECGYSTFMANNS